jgi:hypothetical protein
MVSPQPRKARGNERDHNEVRRPGRARTEEFATRYPSERGRPRQPLLSLPLLSLPSLDGAGAETKDPRRGGWFRPGEAFVIT